MRHLVALFVAVILVTSSLAQSGGLINGTRGIPQPNDGTTGTTLYSTAIVNASGNAILSTTANTTVPVRIVVGGAGTSGNAVLASTGTLAPCTMDAAVASGGGNYYVIESTTTNGQCHPQSAAPAAGTWVIGYLHDATTTSGSTALVHVNGFIYGSGTGGGGSGTVSPNPTTAGALAYYPTAANSTTVSPLAAGVISSTGFGIGVGPSGVYQLGSFTAPDVSLARGAANLLLLTTGGSSGENAYLRSYNSCAVAAPVAFSSSIGQICIRILPAVTRAWIIHCVVPWGFTAGTGSAVVTFSLSFNQAPTASSYFTSVLWASTGSAPISGTTLVSAVGNTPVLTTTGLDSTLTSTVFSLAIDGVFNASSTATTFSLAATTSGGTGVAAEMKAGAYCRVE